MTFASKYSAYVSLCVELGEAINLSRADHFSDQIAGSYRKCSRLSSEVICKYSLLG